MVCLAPLCNFPHTVALPPRIVISMGAETGGICCTPWFVLKAHHNPTYGRAVWLRHIQASGCNGCVVFVLKPFIGEGLGVLTKQQPTPQLGSYIAKTRGPNYPLWAVGPGGPVDGGGRGRHMVPGWKLVREAGCALCRDNHQSCPFFLQSCPFYAVVPMF